MSKRKLNFAARATQRTIMYLYNIVNYCILSSSQNKKENRGGAPLVYDKSACVPMYAAALPCTHNPNRTHKAYYGMYPVFT